MVSFLQKILQGKTFHSGKSFINYAFKQKLENNSRQSISFQIQHINLEMILQNLPIKCKTKRVILTHLLQTYFYSTAKTGAVLLQFVAQFSSLCISRASLVSLNYSMIILFMNNAAGKIGKLGRKHPA